MSIYGQLRETLWNYFKTYDFNNNELTPDNYKEILKYFNNLMLSYLKDKDIQDTVLSNLQREFKNKFDEQTLRIMVKNSKEEFLKKQGTWLYDNERITNEAKQRCITPTEVISINGGEEAIRTHFFGMLNAIRYEK